jgi:hypothetical protein
VSGTLDRKSECHSRKILTAARAASRKFLEAVNNARRRRLAGENLMAAQ